MLDQMRAQNVLRFLVVLAPHVTLQLEAVFQQPAISFVRLVPATPSVVAQMTFVAHSLAALSVQSLVALMQTALSGLPVTRSRKTRSNVCLTPTTALDASLTAALQGRSATITTVAV